MKLPRLSALAVTLGIAGAALLAGPAAAAPHTTYCAVNLDTKVRACAQSQDQARRQSGSMAVVWVVKVYNKTNYNGYLDTFYKSGDCTSTYSDTEIGLTSLGTALNNKITSVKTANHCDVKFFGKANYGGAASTWIDQAADLGTIGTGWSNRASSLKVS